MLAYIEGTIINKTEKGVIVKNNQLGYFIHLPSPILEKVLIEQEITLYLHQQLKEDISDLYGFETFEALSFFKTLLSVNGIGPKVGLDILSLPPDKVKSAIISEDENYICKIPGIGKKTAKRLILELKEKIATAFDLTTHANTSYTAENSIEEEALDALLKLGYQRTHIIDLFKKTPSSIQNTEDLITYFIKNA
ncbi:Holliday junction branch migration protein RuvA [Candidatus Peregrinibacteria bacterium HGW-Peregrinibacteria-1]|jgi:Holliday junction DNA helicase RuvA|nr:MAG: Holliday junction branch migration protein RuvA [Candidatus Peregrinibacteria bacterium HGW-Peregrinibacteria-1]